MPFLQMVDFDKIIKQTRQLTAEYCQKSFIAEA
jgi:hypothetical protein